MHTKCLSIPVNARYVLAWPGLPLSEHLFISDLVHRFNRHTMLLESGHHHLQGREGRVIVVAPAIPARSATQPLPKTPFSTLGGTMPGSPILSGSSSPSSAPSSASYTTPCPTHSSTTRGVEVEIEPLMHIVTVGVASLMTTS